MFVFYTETESFDVSIEPKLTEDQPKQFDREHILLFFTENSGFFRFFFFSRIFGFFRFVLKQFVSLQYRNREFRCFDWIKTNRRPTQTDLVSVCFGSNQNLFLFVSRTPYPSLWFKKSIRKPQVWERTRRNCTFICYMISWRSFLKNFFVSCCELYSGPWVNDSCHMVVAKQLMRGCVVVNVSWCRFLKNCLWFSWCRAAEHRSDRSPCCRSALQTRPPSRPCQSVP
jgi:hypothetical protein